jgi:hypothetical protein
MDLVDAGAATAADSHWLHQSEAEDAPSLLRVLVAEGPTAVAAVVTEQGQVKRLVASATRG